MLTGYTALVTGASKGIGAAIVRELAMRGANVVYCARQSPQLEDVARELVSKGYNCVAVSTDVYNPNEISSCIHTVIDNYGGLDILVNNVGGAIQFGSFFDVSDLDWFKVFELNVMSLVRFSRESVPYLKESELRRIINISSISGVQPGFYNPHYTSTKASVINLSKYLSNILAKDKILVNCVCPGPIHSESWNANINRLSEASNLGFDVVWQKIEMEESAKIPLGRVGEGQDVAKLVAFLADKDSNWITGSCFHINGGKLCSAF